MCRWFESTHRYQPLSRTLFAPSPTSGRGRRERSSSHDEDPKVNKGTGSSKAHDRASLGFRWTTLYVNWTGQIPRDGAIRDSVELREVQHVQACGNFHRAIDLIEKVVRAPIDGDTFAKRYAAYWWWIEAGCPKRYTAPPRAVATDIRRCIRGAA